MLEIEIPASEFFDESTNEFFSVKGIVLRLEHSLVSLSKWESKWKTPFLSDTPKTVEQTVDYVRCMTINQNVDPLVYKLIRNEHVEKINEYISENMTATTFNDAHSPKKSREIVTSELIYFWMAQFNIPMECQKWHLSRLLTLIRIASIKNSPEKKMSKRAILSQNRSLNAARRKMHNTRG